MALVSAVLEILNKPAFGDMMFELMVFMTPIWIAVVVGVLVGWAWKPKWANLNVDLIDYTVKKLESNSAGVLFPQLVASMPSLSSLKMNVPACVSWISQKDASSLTSVSTLDYSSPNLESEKSSLVNEYDLRNLHRLVEEKDGGPAWIQMMDRSTQNMSYQAWRRDAETGPPQYRSRTIYEDATPEMLRDFFWDDEFRLKWDDMLVKAETLEECPYNGTMVVQWVRKFPFFCSDREYIIGRRIWDSGHTYYCVTKGVPSSSVPRRDKPRRVDLYYSSWCIRAAESKRDGRMTACEVLLFHHEDMGIPREIAKLGIRQGMWGAVKKIDPGLRSYQRHRSLPDEPLSRSALMAQINTKFSIESLETDLTCTSEIGTQGSEENGNDNDGNDKKRGGIPRAVVVGGAIALACTLDRGLLTKALIFGVARKLANMGARRL